MASLVTHPQLHQVVFAYLSTADTLQLRLVHRTFGEMVQLFASSCLVEILGASSSTYSANDDIKTPPSIVAAQFILLLKATDTTLDFYNEEQPVRCIDFDSIDGKYSLCQLAFEWLIAQLLNFSRRHRHVSPPPRHQWCAFPHLETMRLEYCPRFIAGVPGDGGEDSEVNDPQLTNMTQMLMELLAGCSRLKTLAILESIDDIERPTLTIDLMRHLSLNCPNLEVFEVDGSVSMPNECFLWLKEFKKLKVLHAPDVKIDPLMMFGFAEEVLPELPHLQVLEIPNYGEADHMLAIVAQNCHQLRSLTVARASDAVLNALAENCQDLTRLDISTGTVSDAGLIAIAKSCAGLRYLNVRMTRSITDSSFLVVTEYCHNIETLDVSGTDGRITDASMAAIARANTNLKALTISGTGDAITDATMTAVGMHCPLLEELSLYEMTTITDNSMVVVGQNCKKLKSLMLHGTQGFITDATISIVAENCRQLEVLEVSLTAGKITDDSITLVVQRCRQLRVLYAICCEKKITPASYGPLLQRSDVAVGVDNDLTDDDDDNV